MVKCLTVTMFNMFLQSTGLDVEFQDGYYWVNSNIPAKYEYADGTFCLVNQTQDGVMSEKGDTNE